MNSSAQRNLNINRREMLRLSAFTAGGLLLSSFDTNSILQSSVPQKADAFRKGKLLETVDFQGEFGSGVEGIMGDELDGRMIYDLSTLTPESLVTPTEKFYIRTCASKLRKNTPWSIRISDLNKPPITIPVEALQKKARSCGVHLMECAGNARVIGFGLMSVAQWNGVPISEVLDMTGIRPSGQRILISGFDTYASVSQTSIPGASWIFTFEQLASAKAFLATSMNDQSLTINHGAPVRLVVPGWYGCTCIKWLEEISLVNDDAEATAQMKEFATRTNQGRIPLLAREYLPALIDTTAMPVRIEKWQVDGGLKYRVVGILWGGNQLIKELQIQFNPEENYIPVSDFCLVNQQPWCLWTHMWQPKKTGVYKIRLKVKDPYVLTRRLDSGFYVRSVEITEI
jgi:DMSO/TMAO reductase YedYZ molybdopterin-dependent catalytic subunit